MAKKAVDPIKAKQARQKKIVIGGSVVLCLLLAIQGPKLMKQMKGDSGPPPAWRTPAPTVAPAGPVDLAAPTLGGTDPTAPAGTAAPGALTAESQVTAAVGQLATFGRFASKDPFASQTPTTSTTTPPTPPAPPTPGGIPGVVTPTGATTGPAAPAAPITAAVIAVNGIRVSVTAGSDFPAPTAQDPTPAAFHLVSVSAHSAKISVAGGSYADGAATLTLKEGKPVTLMNTADGTRYTIELYPQGTAVPTPGSTTGGTTTPAAPAPAPSTTTTSTSTKSTSP